MMLVRLSFENVFNSAVVVDHQISTEVALANDQRKSVIQAIFTSRKFFPDPYGQTSFSIVDHQITSGQHGFGSLPSIS
ncbi:hypothetical protein T03_11880 [Trichinella britovi]|uniref:Uncharacterized protein n=1 Tax=Trichinella britovi TaxID=45882 RepID=A0A0V1CMT5_TRIBR|nr:hypothetical protein T03_11880 [Trichinella britovi]